MKIGVLTFHRSYNNGAILQAYALTHKLSELGANVQIIDFRNDGIENPAKIIIKGEKITAGSALKVIYRLYRHTKIDKFIKRNLELSSSVRNYDDFNKIENHFDRFVTGSDQVWNNTHIKGNKCFFLDFVDDNKKKYSYAASIGGDEKKAQETIDLYSEYIKEYQIISLREGNVENYFKSIYGNKVRCDIDPVLLLKKEQWLKLVSKRPCKKKYIFMYLVPKSGTIRKFAENFAKKYDCILIDNKTSKEYFTKCGIEDFLSWLYYAEVVITNSFHGTAFSVIFEKEFYVEYNTEIGFNYRVDHLTKALDINSVEIIDDNPPEKRIVQDFDSVNKKLDELRDNSINYLESIVSGR